MLKLQNIQLVKKERLILNNISCQINAGDSIGIVGPSGSGKSSLLRLLNLLHSPTSGEIYYRDKNLLDYDPIELRQQIGYIPQKASLFGTTIEENLLYPYLLLHKTADANEILDYLDRVSLPKDILQKKPTELSGGEQQRVALIRSLLIRPQVLLLDEVTASLDKENMILIEQLILHEKTKNNLTVILVSHNMEQIQRIAQKTLQIADGQINFYGTTTEFFALKGEPTNE